jgi:diguanylate cyclase (GGDEF)-like protein
MADTNVTKSARKQDEMVLVPRSKIATYEDTIRRLKAEAETDDLTGLLRVNPLNRTLSVVLGEFNRNIIHGAACVFIDVDGFKAVNDLKGHAVGDVLLQDVSVVLIDEARTEDQVFRPGGDEFVVILPGVTAAGARAYIERVRARVEEENLEIKLSAGVSMLRHEKNPRAVLDRAEAEMRRAKELAGVQR